MWIFQVRINPRACVFGQSNPLPSVMNPHIWSQPIANGWASIAGYKPASLPDISLLCLGRVSFFAILVCEAAPSWATEVPKACVWPVQSIAKCHEPSHMVPIANGWASIAGYMAASLPNISLLCGSRVLIFAILVCESDPSWAT